MEMRCRFCGELLIVDPIRDDVNSLKCRNCGEPMPNITNYVYCLEEEIKELKAKLKGVE